MKKTLYILSALLLGLVSCNKAEIDTQKPEKVEETGLVAITMKLQIPTVLEAETRASGMAHKPQIDAIRVAVFGTSGYPQAYAYAEPIEQPSSSPSAPDRPGSYAAENDQTYYFKVLLPVYDGEAHVHVIANGDEEIQFVGMDEEKIMTKMRTSGNVGGYWARVIMPDGILPKMSNDGIMETDGQGNFKPSDGTAHLFEDLVLVRNFAEVLLDYQPISDEFDMLSDIRWTLVNVPYAGSIAPMAAGTYVDDYKDYTYNANTGRMVKGATVYDGYMFPDSEEDPTLNTTRPEDGSINHKIFVEGQVDENNQPIPNPNFMYERRYPGEEPATCILLQAKYHNDNYYTYYRIDLMDEKVGGYYPIYRNYQYKVTIKKVGNRGARTIAEAMNHESGGNVSQTTEARKLTDISDGVSRLYVEFVEKNYTYGGVKTFWVQYVPDVTTGTVDNTHVSVSIKDKGNALVEGATVERVDELSDVHDKYYYQVELKGQNSSMDLVSVLQVKADNGLAEDDDNRSTLYRLVTMRVLKKMEMTLQLVPKKVDQGAKKKTILQIHLPQNLPSSMFPLEMHIEDYNHTLNPTGSDGYDHDVTVPVKTGTSLSDDGTNSFYFIRTVLESEYNRDNGVISTEFETIQQANRTTIYVANEYFNTKNINLLNEGILITPLTQTVSFDVESVTVEVDTDDDTKTWTVTPGTDVTLSRESGRVTVKSDGTLECKGRAVFRMTFGVNTSSDDNRLLTAAVAYDGETETVRITQETLDFSISPRTREIPFTASNATFTVYAKAGVSWTVTVDNGATLSTASGTGQQTITVSCPANTTTSAKTYTVTAAPSDHPDIHSTATITQRRGPNPSATFTVNDIGFSQMSGNAGSRGLYSGSADSSDSYVRISMTNVYQPNSANGYVQMGYRYGGGWFGIGAQTYQGAFTVTPSSGIRITRIIVHYSDETFADYDNQNGSVTTGSYSISSDTGTWTLNTTNAATRTNGYLLTSGDYYFPRITSIEVIYQPA